MHLVVWKINYGLTVIHLRSLVDNSNLEDKPLALNTTLKSWKGEISHPSMEYNQLNQNQMRLPSLNTQLISMNSKITWGKTIRKNPLPSF